MRRNILIVSGLFLSLIIFSQSLTKVALDSIHRDPNYVKAIVTRSKRIVVKLNLKNQMVEQNVINIVANRYFELNDIYALRDSTINNIKKSTLTNELKKQALLLAEDKKESALYRSHFAFPANLSLFLSDHQIEEIKDGITFGVVKVTYDATLDMIPTLKPDEKTQILAWLKEAREFALDAESATKKHEAFGKYKGRINNYLAKNGYDLKKERDAWYMRIKAKAELKK